MDYVNRYPVHHSLCPASLQRSFRLELFSTKRHAVLNLKGATFKIFIMIDPTVMSFPLSARGASLSHQESAWTTGNLGCHSTNTVLAAQAGAGRRERIIEGGKKKTQQKPNGTFTFLSLAARKVLKILHPH